MSTGLPFEALKPYLADYVAAHLEASPSAGVNMYNCPVCGSGSREGGTGALHVTETKNSWYCHAHHEGGDVTALHAAIHGLTPGDAVKDLAGRYGVEIPKTDNPLSSLPTQHLTPSTGRASLAGPVTSGPPPKRETTYSEAVSVSFTPWLDALRVTPLSDVPAVVSYLAARGLTVADATKVGAVVWDASNPAHARAWRREWGYPPKADLALVFPYAGGSYWQARLLEGARNEGQRWDKPEVGKAGKDPLHGAETLTSPTDKTPLVFVEGIPDALAVRASGRRALAVGTTNVERGADLALELLPANVPLIEALDVDKPGRDAARKLEGLLEGRDLVSLWSHLEAPQGVTDLGDVAALRGGVALSEALTLAGSPLLRLEAESVGASLDGFLQRVQDAQRQPLTSTGLEGLDDALEGGLVAGLYIVGAQSSVGKTTLTMQIADHVAASGTRPVVVFSLEQGRDELIAKSLSRLTAQLGPASAALSASNIRFRGRSEAWTLEQGDALDKAIATYEAAARHLWIYEGVGDLGADDVARESHRVATLTGTAPLIVIDYLQILAPYDLRATDKQATDRSVTALKRISRDLGAPVLAVSSLNRASYSGPVTMAAFKESGAIEFGSDVLLGVQPAGLNPNDTNAASAENTRVMINHKKSLKRDVEINILKNRNGPTGATVPLTFEPVFSLFTDRNPLESARYVPSF